MGPFKDEHQGLYEAAEQGSARQAKQASRRVRRRDTEEQVERSLKTHFPGWTALEVDGHRVEGRTLRQQLTQDRKAVKNGSMRLGSSYWKDMQAKFGGPSRPTRSLQVKNAADLVSPVLMDALAVATHNNTTLKSRAPLSQYFASSDTVNQKEYVGILRHMLEIRPSTSTAAAAFYIDFMKFVARHRLHTHFPTETDQVKDLMDQAIASYHSTNLNPVTYSLRL